MVTAKQVADWLRNNTDKFCVVHYTPESENKGIVTILGLHRIQYVKEQDAILIITQHIGPNALEVSKK